MNQEESTEQKLKLSEILTSVFSAERGSVSIGQLLDELDHHGLAIILILFSIPSAVPLPAAGYSTVLSIPLFFIAFCFFAGRNSLWLPEKVREKSINLGAFKKINHYMLKIVSFIERFSKPRFISLVRSSITRVLLGVVICLCACSMVLPIPGTNTLPAGGIFLIGFSLLEDDGILLLGGVLYSIAALIMSAFIIFVGYEVVKAAILSIF